MQTGQGFLTPVGKSVLQTYKDLCDARPRVHLGAFLAFLTVSDSSFCLLSSDRISVSAILTSPVGPPLLFFS